MAIGLTKHDKRFHANELFDGKSPNEVAELAGLNWTAHKTNRLIGIVDGIDDSDDADDGFAVTSEDQCFIIRGDTKQVIGYHSNKYTPYQNSDMIDMFNYLDSDCKIANAGSFFGGKRVYMSAFTESIGIKGTDDELQPYFYIANSFDGTMNLSMFDSSIRVWCNNSLNLALKMGKKKMRTFTHKGDLHARIEEMHRALGMFKENTKKFDEKINFIASKTVTQEQVRDFFNKSFEKLNPTFGKKTEDQVSAMVDSFLEDCFSIFENEMTLTGSDGTLWLAANAVTQRIQHQEFEKKRSNNSLQAERRMWDNVFGENDDLSADIMNYAFNLAEKW